MPITPGAGKFVTCSLCGASQSVHDTSKPTVNCQKCNRDYHCFCVGLSDDSEADWTCEDCRDGTVTVFQTSKAQEEVRELKQKLEEVTSKFQEQASRFKATKEKELEAKEIETAKLLEELSAMYAQKIEAATKLAAEKASEVARKHEEDLAQLRLVIQSQATPINPLKYTGAVPKTTEPKRVSIQQAEPQQVDDPFDFFGEGDLRSTGISNSTPFVHERNLENQTRMDESLCELAATMKRQFIPKLPRFSGEEKEWNFFESCFDSSTIEGKFTEAENVLRLREALKAPALDLVRDQVMFSTDASAIMSALKKTYGRPERLIILHTQEILAIKPLSRPSDPALREFAIKMKNFVANMKALRRESELCNEYTLSVLADKLREATSFYMGWSRRKFANPRANLETFADFLMEKVDEMPPPLPSSQPSESKSPSSVRSTQRVSTHKEVKEKPPSQDPLKSSSCGKCSGKHPMWKCREFLDMDTLARRNFARSKRICFSCLNSSEHQAKDCRRSFKCGVDGCESSHNRTLHEKEVKKPEVAAAQNHHKYAVLSTKELPTHKEEDSKATLFKILPVRLHGNNGKFVDTYAFLDDGSSLTLVEESVAIDLGLSGVREELELQWTKNVRRKESSLRTQIDISGVKAKKIFSLNNIYTVKDVELPEQSVDAQELKKKYPHLKGLPLPTLEGAKPKILIGLDQAKFLVGSSNRMGNQEDPIATRTRLGWAVYGKASLGVNFVNCTRLRKPTMLFHAHEATKNDEELHNLVKSYFTTESFGIVPSKVNLVSEETQRAVDVMERTLKYDGKRYEIGLLWKSDDIVLPNSLPMAMKRLVSFERTLAKRPELLEWVNAQIKALVDKGYARVATEQELSKRWPRIWYTPTFVVHNMNKIPPKPRLVADVAAKIDGQSLNTNLLKGPDNLAPLLAGLFKFRENAIAVTADVREMFHQIRITPEDQQCQRLLWREAKPDREPTTYVMQSMMFGPTCSPTCAQFVKNHHANLFREQYPKAVDALTKRTYVDDYNNSEPTVAEANQVLEDASKICNSMGFQLVAVQSNSTELLRKRPEVTLKDKLIGISFSETENYTSKVLGMLWRAFADNFTFKLFEDETVDKMRATDYRPTKREVLRTIMRIYDPLGLISNYLIRGKVVLQEIWRDGTDWDEAISEPLQVCWRNFVTQLQNIENLAIPRHYAPVVPSKSNVELVVFADASEIAFAATAYFRFASNEQVHVAHVMGKAKVAPIKKLSIPQLELQAAVLGIRLANTIKAHHAFAIHRTTFLVDAKVVLAWICSKKYNFKSFVAVRIGEILESSTRKDWHHIGSKDNVADDATKWTDPSMGDNNARWFRGPDFLRQSRETWPIKPADDFVDDEQVKTETRLMVHTVSVAKFPEVLIYSELSPRFKSSWNSSVRVIAFLMRIRDKAKRISSFIGTFVEPKEFDRAELLLFKSIQQGAYPHEITSLMAKQAVDASSKLLAFSPILSDDGVIRMSSRAQKASCSYASKNPVILPNKHELVDLLIQQVHKDNFHIGEESTIADLRERAWIVNVRSALRRVTRACQVCKIKRAKPASPMMGQLPRARLDFGCKAFTHTGVDCFGPMEVKFGRGKQKRYGILFTCLTYRAIHLELINDLSTDQCLAAIRRLFTLRGRSVHFYSDNGKNFIGAHNQLARDYKQTLNILGEEAAKRFHLTWNFLPAYSPWMGGAWERLIGSVKRCIEFMLQGETPHEHILRDVLYEAEYQMNRRPLTHMPVDSEDAKPLTPNMMLFNESEDEDASAAGYFDEADAVSSKGHRRVQHLAQKYTARWFKEYLPEITRRTKWHKSTPPIEVGSLVIIIEPDELGKITHKRGFVTKIYPGPDNIVRQADVRLKDGKIKPRRAVKNMAVLDVSSSSPDPAIQTARGMSSTVSEQIEI